MLFLKLIKLFLIFYIIILFEARNLNKTFILFQTCLFQNIVTHVQN